MEIRIVMLAVIAALMFGCTANPQETGQAGVPDGSGNGGGNPDTPPAGYTMEEVAKHSTKGDCWTVVGDMVVDLSNFTTHPAGDTYVPFCGKDGTEGFATKGGKNMSHSPKAQETLGRFAIGTLRE